MDALDAAVVETLRTNGRIRGSELALELGVSRSAATARLNTLLHAGTVRVIGVVHPAVLGLTSVAHISVVVDRPVVEVASELAKIDEIPFVSIVVGVPSLVAEIRAPSGADLAACLDRVRQVPGVRTLSTLTYTQMLVDVLRPWATSRVSLDETDVALLGLLQADGRMSYTEMSSRTGLSIGTVRIRVRRLLDERIIRIGVLTSPGAGEQQYAIGIGILARGDISGVVDALAANPVTTFLATTVGRFDILATLKCSSLRDGAAAVDRIRQQEEVIGVETWLHLEVFKEVYQFSRINSPVRAALP